MSNINLNKLKYFIVLILLLIPFNSASGAEKWESGIYLEPWLAFVDGDAKHSNFPATDLDSDIISGLLGLETRKGNTGFYLEISGMKWKEDTLSTPYNRMEFRYSVTELGGSYRFFKNTDFLLGIRHQGFGTEYMQPAASSFEKSTGALDFFAGFRVTRHFGKEGKWNVVVAADAGTGDSDFVWSVKTSLGYQFSEHWSVSLSLRELDTDFEKDGIKYDGRLNTCGFKVEYFF
ncbi:MAG: hypothetical protein PVG39_21200 [Desulfobacteraceae bacterium]